MATGTPLPVRPEYDFSAKLGEHDLALTRQPLEILQINVTRLCNQACHHCHVDASPKRTEHMGRETVERVLQLLEEVGSVHALDITGGAPELSPFFKELVERSRALGKAVIARHNLTVQLDPHPQTGESMDYLPAFFAEHQVEVVSSLPYYAEYFTDKQRGRGVFKKSVEAMRRLNAVGIGTPDGLPLTLVYNPVGAFLPPDQEGLERDYKRALERDLGVTFTNLFTITNMPIARFKAQLERQGNYDGYMEKLLGAFNPTAAAGVMCRSLISVDYDGRVFDCDFNQMLDMQVEVGGRPLTIFDLDPQTLAETPILFDSHCFGCTAGAGSSCGGATA